MSAHELSRLSRNCRLDGDRAVTQHLTWQEIWGRRQLAATDGPVLPRLLEADGFDGPLTRIAVADWSNFVRGWAREAGISEGTSVFEVGCGAGAFAYELDRLGAHVSGLDLSPAMVSIAADAIPNGRFYVTDAAELPLAPTVDVVVAVSVAMYFPSLAYASEVVGRMAAKATKAVLWLDIPDEAKRDQAVAARIAACGGPDAYHRRYAGLDHQYYDREWVLGALRASGLERVQCADQNLRGYSHAAHRFNAWGFKK